MIRDRAARDLEIGKDVPKERESKHYQVEAVQCPRPFSSPSLIDANPHERLLASQKDLVLSLSEDLWVVSTSAKLTI